MRIRRQLVLPVAVMAAMVVGSAVFASAQAKKPATATKKAAAKRLRVFFIEPKNGATVSSPLHMKFGSEGIEIGAVPQGDVKTARKGIAHYHVGIDQSCLPAGKNIGPSVILQDAYASVKVSNALIVDTGLVFVPASRDNLTLTGTLLPIDYGPFTFSDATARNPR